MSRYRRWVAGLVMVVVSSGLCVSVPAAAFPAEVNVALPAPMADNAKAPGPLQTAVIAGGCFWGVQGVFEHVSGVKKVRAGYSGGEKSTAQYDVVSSGGTGHAEAVQIVFDPKEVSYGELLRVYFSVAHDPTELNRQGPDTGTQYRSDIFYADESQKKIAQAYIAQLDKARIFNKPIVTRVDPLKGFYPAEDYHQDFLIKNPQWPYIVINDIPKIQNLKKVFPAYYRGQPVTVKGAN
jgi:peptide-methionine (S)-S-oxide reductase